MKPPDIRTIADESRWTWEYEQSFAAERPELRDEESIWLVEVPCKRGMIYPLGPDRLAAYTSTRGVAGQLLDLDPEVRRVQTGDGEATVSFPARLLDRVAGILHPRRRATKAAPSWDTQAAQALARWPPRKPARSRKRPLQSPGNRGCFFGKTTQEARSEGRTTSDPSGSLPCAPGAGNGLGTREGGGVRE